MAAPGPLGSLSAADRAALEALLVNFDRQWYDGKLAEFAVTLPAADNPTRLPALVEMIKIDLERQWQMGNRVSLAAYLTRFPELTNDQAIVADLLQAERGVRQDPNAADSTPEEADPFDTLQAPPSGRYRVLRKLGQGNMATVYLVEDTRLGRQVALKVPHFRPEDGPEIRARFFREARALAAVHHPNLCPVFDVGEHKGVPFLTMAHVEGGPLSKTIQGSPPWSQHAAASLVRQLALGLAEAHERGIIHRDLKPANVLLTRDNEPVVVDFGLARCLSPDEIRLTGTGSLLGTPAYMAPEQAAGESANVGPSCDIYSLGVILYELLTGRLPFEGPLIEVLLRVRDQPPVPLATYRPDVDPELEAICNRAMAKQPKDRYPAMRDFAAALDHFLGTEPNAPLPRSDNAAVPDALTAKISRPSVRNRRLAAIAGLVLVASLVAVTVWYISRPSPETPELPPGTPGPDGENRQPVAANTLVQSFHGNQGRVVGAAFLTDADELISGGDDHAVRFWDVNTGNEKTGSPWKFDDLTNVRGLTADGRFVLTSSLQSLSLRRIEGRREVRTVLTGGAHLDAAAISSDGRRFVAGIREAPGKALVMVWDVEAEQPLGSWPGHEGQIVCVALSSDGRRAVSASNDRLRVWEVSTGKVVREFKPGLVVSVAISPTGDRFLIAGPSASIRLWETDAESDPDRLDGHIDGVTCLAFSPNGRRALSGGLDRTVRLWELSPIKELACLGKHTGPVTCVSFSATGDRAVSGAKDGELRLWRLE